jgi:arylsulfatase
LGDENAYQPENRGFDEVFIHGCGGIGQSYNGSCGDVPLNSYFDPIIKHNGRFEKTNGYCTDVFFRQALNWIVNDGNNTAKEVEADLNDMFSRKENAPFFAYIATNAPHKPYFVPNEYFDMYKGKLINVSIGEENSDNFNEEIITDNIAKYFGMITNIDANVGKLLISLQEKEIEENTLIIFCTDNGGKLIFSRIIDYHFI